MFIAKNAEVEAAIPTPYGTKYIVQGWIESPEKRRAFVLTVRVIEAGQAGPRLVTAYPM
jgi:hypothetical protein